jgi:aminopeptidase YwaD
MGNCRRTGEKGDPPVTSILESLSAGVDQGLLMASMRVFAERTKLSGTPQEAESFRYLEQCMQALGFRTELIRHDAYISLPGAADVTVDGRRLVAITHSFSRASPPEGLRGRLVYVREGAAEDFARDDLGGSILLVEGIASPAVAARAATAQAAGQIHISPHEHIHEMCISPVWGSPSPEMLARLPTTVAASVSLADGAALRDRLARGEAPEVVIHAEVDTGWRSTPLLVADMVAPELGEADQPFVLFSGHHDTWYYGVMDNGGANATMLEVARLCASHRAAWRRGLRVCFWSGHSHGRYSGSAWYADQHWDELDRRCVAHVNVDSTGGIGATVLGESGVAGELAGLAAEAVRTQADAGHAGKPQSRSSDMSFWGIGIPAMFGSISHQPPSPVKMRNALGWWWHTPHDTLDKIDPAYLVRDTRIVLHAVWRLLSGAVLPIDVSAQARALLTEVERLAATVGDRLALGELVRSAQDLEARAKSLTARAAAAGAPEAALINQAIMRFARALVPIDCTEGDRFRHDPALPLPAWPVLQPIRDFSAAPAGSDASRFLAVAAVRARNRVLDAVRHAHAALDLAE